MSILQQLQQNMPLVLFVLCIVVLAFAIALFYMAQKLYHLRKRLDGFTGGHVRPDVKLEEVLTKYAEDVTLVKGHTVDLLRRVGQLEDNMVYCNQKVGVIRYNPYEESGGNLCFAVAILDGNDDGVVFNGIYSRTGTYVYAKPIEMGVSIYVLSEEELAALEKAKASAYVPVDKT